MAIKIGQEFERTSKATRFKDDVLTKSQMLSGTDDNYSDGYLVVEKDSHDLYIYNSSATPSAETGKFVKFETGSSNLPMTKTVLWELPQGAVINPDNITLTNPTSDYDQILIEGFVSSQAKDHIMSCLIMAEDLHTTNAVGLSDQAQRYIWYNVDSPTSWSKRIGDGGILVYRVYGIKFGSSLDGTIGRWEKIGEFPLNATSSIGVDLSEYNFFSATLLNGSHPTGNVRNSVNISRADLEEGLSFIVSEQADGDKWGSAKIDFTNSTIQINGYGAVTSLVLYGYKETAISDADVQKIADATALKSTNMEALWNNGELKGMKLFKNDNDLRIFDDGQVLLIDGNTTTRVNLTTKNYVDTEVAKKQDTLTAGTNITIDANNVISASGGGGGDVPENIVTARATTGAGNVDIYSMTGTSNEYTPVGDKVTMDLRVIQGGTYSDLPEFNILTAGAGNPIYSKHLATTDYVDTELAKKQNTLVSGTNIKTFNGESLLGSGDIPIPTIVGSDWGVAKAGVIPSVGTSATVSIDISELGLSSVNDYTVNLDIINGGEIYPASTLRIASRTATSFVIRNTSTTNVYGAVYTVFAKGCGSVPNGGTTGQALVKKSDTDGDVEWKTVSGGGASLTIDTTQVGYGEATVSEGGYNLSFTNQNGQGVHIGGISENGEIVASKSYVDTQLATKQNTLTAGNGIQINNNIISSQGIDMKIDAEKWYGTYTDENNVTYQVYTKTIYIPALPATAGITTYQHGITGIKQILSAYGFTTDGFVLNAPRQTTSDNIAIYQVQKSATGGIAIEVGKDRSSKSAYVTLIYAKNN